MQLNPDCVRAVLLAVEDKELGEIFTIDRLEEQLSDYTTDEIVYTCLKLDEAGYLEIVTVPMMGQHHPGIKSIKDLTFDGHQFLELVRDNSVWKETKEKAKTTVKSFSLNVLSQIAGGIITRNMGI